MEELINLIIQLIAALFDGKNKIAQPPPPPRKSGQPPDIDMYQSVQQALGGPSRRPSPQRRILAMQNRRAQVPVRRQAMVNIKRQPSRPSPLNRAVAAPQRVPQPRVAQPTGQVQRTVPTTNAPPRAVAPINADSVGKLLRNKPAALRTIYVLTELIGKPVGLREE